MYVRKYYQKLKTNTFTFYPMATFKDYYPDFDLTNRHSNIELSLEYAHSKLDQLTGIKNIWDYIEKNRSLLDNIKGNSATFSNSLRFFNVTQNSLKEFLQLGDHKDPTQLMKNWPKFKTLIENNAKQNNIIPATSAEGQFLIQLHKINPSEAWFAFNFIINKTIEMSNVNGLTGSLKAFFFKYPEYSNGNDNLKSYSASAEIAKSELERYLTETGLQLEKIINDNKEKSVHLSNSVNSIINTSQTSFKTWFESKQKQFTEFDNSTIQKIKDFEELYTEKLRLEAPTTYWRERADKLNKTGRSYLIWLIALALLGSGLLFSLLWSTPDGLLTSIFEGDKVKAIRWSIVFIVFLSFFAYSIRILAKITFSSFHLARDAEEREQLTHVYLALKKDAAVDEKDRSLILQSIFSRADTGLLKEDSAPTMPGGILDKAISR